MTCYVGGACASLLPVMEPDSPHLRGSLVVFEGIDGTGKSTQIKLLAEYLRAQGKEVITDMLITELGYKGIIITDSFSMGAVTEEYENGEAAVMAIKAGVDMILMPQSLGKVHESIVKAVEAGEISEERINESVRKILTLKYNKNMLG